MEKKRISYLDMTKGIGIILVVIGHSTFAGDKLLTWLVSFHMPLFFIVSGMLIQHIGEEKKDIKNIILRKLKSIMLPYLTFSILYFIVKFLYLIRMPELITIEDIKKAGIETISFYGISVLWFLPALFVGEIVFLSVRKKCKHTLTILIGMVFATVAIMGKPLLDTHFNMEASYAAMWLGCFVKMLFRSCIAYVFLMIGYYAKAYLVKEKEKIQWHELLIALALLCFNIWGAFQNIRVDLNFLVFGNPVLYFVTAYCGAMALVLLCKNMKTVKPLVFLGVNSLVIMATHVECQILMIAIRISSFVAFFFETGQTAVMYLMMIITVTVMELITIYVFNHYLYFSIGKTKMRKGGKHNDIDSNLKSSIR